MKLYWNWLRHRSYLNISFIKMPQGLTMILMLQDKTKKKKQFLRFIIMSLRLTLLFKNINFPLLLQHVSYIFNHGNVEIHRDNFHSSWYFLYYGHVWLSSGDKCIDSFNSFLTFFTKTLQRLTFLNSLVVRLLYFMPIKVHATSDFRDV